MTTARARIILVCLGLAGGFALAEALLRAAGVPRQQRPHSTPPQFLFLRDPNTGDTYYVNTPSSPLRFEYDGNPRGYFDAGSGVEHPTNADGFRGPELTAEKPPRTLRILFFGDSFTFGEGVRFADTFVARTGRLLGDRLVDTGVGFECINLGVGGYNTADELFMLRKLAGPLRADAVVLSYVLNDAEPALFEVDPERGPVRRARDAHLEEAAGTPEGAASGSRVVGLVRGFFEARRRSQATEEAYRRLYRADAPDWQRTRRALGEMAAWCKREGLPFYVMTFPILHRLDAGHPFRDLYAAVRDHAASEGAVTIDLLPAFTGHAAETLWVHPTDHHPNDVAHGLAAETLAEALAGDAAFAAKIREVGGEPSRP